METIILGKAAEGCSQGVKDLAIFGGIVLIAAVYALMVFFIREILLSIKGKRFSELSRTQKESVNLYSAFWIITVPLTIAFGALYWLAKWIVLPFIAAEKRDLREMEDRINKKIIINTPINKNKKPSTKFVVGDLITGVKGNPDGYKHLNEGSVCRVLSIDDKGKMSVVLVDHAKFVEHTEQIGKIFKAPARNFVKYTAAKKAKIRRR